MRQVSYVEDRSIRDRGRKYLLAETPNVEYRLKHVHDFSVFESGRNGRSQVHLENFDRLGESEFQEFQENFRISRFLGSSVPRKVRLQISDERDN